MKSNGSGTVAAMLVAATLVAHGGVDQQVRRRSNRGGEEQSMKANGWNIICICIYISWKGKWN